MIITVIQIATSVVSLLVGFVGGFVVCALARRHDAEKAYIRGFKAGREEK